MLCALKSVIKLKIYYGKGRIFIVLQDHVARFVI